MAKNISVYGIFPDRVSLSTAIDALRQAGFRDTDISVLMADNVGNKDFGHEKETKAPEGALAGAGAGSIIGGTLGVLAALGALAIPGVGPLIAAGPIVAALTGIGAGGIVGGLAGGLIGAGIPEYVAKRYEGRIRSGGVLCSVHCDDADWVGRAKRIMNDTGAEDVSATGEAPADFARSTRPMPRIGNERAPRE
ncbi:MAG: DUF3341 domain-containing protein [Bryobacteraceae bacterium]|nr:DUF3341 domain-containing protein [Bryobacteraceae bacterium]